MQSRYRGVLVLVLALALWACASAAYAATVPDAYEPNGDFDTATLFDLVDVTKWCTFDNAYDVDYFTQELRAGEYVTVWADAQAETVRPQVRVYDPTRTQVAFCNVAQVLDDAISNRTRLNYRAPTAGTYYFRFSNAALTEGGYRPRYATWSGITPTTRSFEGADRYAVAASTALAMSQECSVTDVIVASGLDRAAADSLVASGMSRVLGGSYAPILLVRADRAALPGATADALRVLAQRSPTGKLGVHVVGGPASVPNALLTKIRAAAPVSSLERFTGADRYAVAAAVAARVQAKGLSRTAFVTNGAEARFFYDALSLGPVAARNRIPILLVKRTAVPAATGVALRSFRRVWIVGSGDAIGTSVRTALGNVGDRMPESLSGDTRQRVARLVAERSELSWYTYTPNLLPGGPAVVVNKLPDALAAGPYAGMRGAQLLYADTSSVPQDTIEFLQGRAGADWGSRPAISELIVFGGPASVSAAARGVVERVSGILP